MDLATDEFVCGLNPLNLIKIEQNEVRFARGDFAFLLFGRYKSAVVPHTGRYQTATRTCRFFSAVHARQKAQRRIAQNGRQATGVAPASGRQGSDEAIRTRQATQAL